VRARQRRFPFSRTRRPKSHNFFWRPARADLKSAALMTKRNTPPAPAPRLAPNFSQPTAASTVKLVTCHDGEHKHFAEPSVACAARHAIDICDNEEGCAQLIQANGETVWKFDPARPRASLEQLDELAQGPCVRG
jgi:hypothetical protein